MTDLSINIKLMCRDVKTNHNIVYKQGEGVGGRGGGGGSHRILTDSFFFFLLFRGSLK